MPEGDLIRSLIRVSPFLLVILVICLRIRQRRIAPAEIGIARPNSWAGSGIWIACFIAFALLIEWLVWTAGLLELGGFRHQGLSAALRIAGMVVLAPIAEELLFRGLLLNWLERHTGRFAMAAALQAAAFAALHSFAYEGSLISSIGTVQSFVDAMIFAYARRQTASIFTPILMHASGNLIAVIEMLA